MMANKEDLYRLEKLVNTPGADEDEIRVLRKALWERVTIDQSRIDTTQHQSDLLFQMVKSKNSAHSVKPQRCQG